VLTLIAIAVHFIDDKRLHPLKASAI